MAMVIHCERGSDGRGESDDQLVAHEH
jgi:hypothetical protein